MATSKGKIQALIGANLNCGTGVCLHSSDVNKLLLPSVLAKKLVLLEVNGSLVPINT